ncbi:hypothetical protein THAR02_04340 [Trichoderma harzianum]|uniref:Uncharacterized protein n=1 Tax=Trichoderma harzianum TaxID=5544 RepID=A0A0F9XTZ1_TRIHA|nr:hypothetical protein THAR02_04340 [Trichoderma harzianum]
MFITDTISKGTTTTTTTTTAKSTLFHSADGSLSRINLLREIVAIVGENAGGAGRSGASATTLNNYQPGSGGMGRGGQGRGGVRGDRGIAWAGPEGSLSRNQRWVLRRRGVEGLQAQERWLAGRQQARAPAQAPPQQQQQQQQQVLASAQAPPQQQQQSQQQQQQVLAVGQAQTQQQQPPQQQQPQQQQQVLAQTQAQATAVELPPSPPRPADGCGRRRIENKVPTSPSVLLLRLPPPRPVGPTAALQAAGPARSSAVAVAAAEPAGLVGPPLGASLLAMLLLLSSDLSSMDEPQAHSFSEVAPGQCFIIAVATSGILWESNNPPAEFSDCSNRINIEYCMQAKLK